MLPLSISKNSRYISNENNELHVDTSEKMAHELKNKYGSLVFGFAYYLSSYNMILLNKIALLNYDFNVGKSLTFYQENH